MKKLLITFALLVSTAVYAIDNHAAADAAKAQHETKQVCVNVQKDGKDVLDPKTKQPKQTCKTVKEHKKLQGTAIPEKK
jgi:hypothetical protein